MGIKGSSIYNHFNSKNDILEEILNYQQSVLNEKYNNKVAGVEIEKLSGNTTIEEILIKTMQTSFENLQIPMLNKILKILSQEQLNNDTIREYFYNDYILKARKELILLFNELQRKGMINYPDTEFLANEFHSYVIYKYYENYLLKSECEIDIEKLREEMLKHINFFCKAIKS